MSPRSTPHLGGRGLILLPLVAFGGLLLAACDATPEREFMVDTFVDASDANPGDGICEVTPGAGDCSLRAAIDEANATPEGTRVIAVLQPGTHLVTGTGDDANASGDLDITGDLTIGAGGPGVVVQGAGSDRAFDVRGSVKIGGITISGGQTTGAGGAIDVAEGADLQLIVSTVTANIASTGGGVNVAGTATISVSTISGNTGGAVSVTGTGTLTTSNATITGNVGGGIDSDGAASLSSSIVADQTTGADCVGVAPNSGGHNLDSDGTCLTAAHDGDLPSADAALAPLLDRGGYTPTHLPRPSSDALDADHRPETLPIDQRLMPRPQGAASDIGATEATADEHGSPVAVDDAGAGFATDEDTAVTTADVRANDTDPMLDPLAVVGLDTTDTVGTVVDNGDGTFDYDPAGRFEDLHEGDSVTDTFTYTVADLDGQTDVATVTIGVVGVDDAPVATGDDLTGAVPNTPVALGQDPAGAAVRIAGSLLDGDTDADDPAGSLTAELHTAPGTGDLDLDPDGTFTYRPAAGLRSTVVSFTYVPTAEPSRPGRAAGRVRPAAPERQGRG